MKIQKISIPVNEQQITGTLLFPEQPKPKNPAVLMIHGWSSSESGYLSRAKAIVKHGFIALTINLRGHGTSTGNLEDFSRRDHLNDALAAYDFLASQQGVDTSKIGAVGASYGGYLISLLSSKRNLKYIVMRAPALYQDRDFDTPTAYLISEDEKIYKQTNLSPADNAALKAISLYENHFLLVESELDVVCPKETTQTYLTSISPKAKITYKIIKNAEHNLQTTMARQAFIDILDNWFKALAIRKE